MVYVASARSVLLTEPLAAFLDCATRLPGLLVRFTGPDEGLWAQLVGFARDLDPGRVAVATGTTKGR